MKSPEILSLILAIVMFRVFCESDKFNYPPLFRPKRSFSGVSTRAKLCCFPAHLCVWFPDLWHKGHQFPVGSDQRRRLKISPSHPIVRVLGGGCRLFFFFFCLGCTVLASTSRGVAYRSWFDPPIGRFSRRLWESPAFTLRATNRIKPAPSLNMWLANCTVVVEHYLVLRFYGSVFSCHVSVWRRHYLSNALSCCACWQVFKLKLELWSDQPVLANINFPPLFVVFISGIFREQCLDDFVWAQVH